MMRQRNIYRKGISGILLLFFIGVFSTCISDFEPKGMDGKGGMLVVEGIITNDTTRILLSKSASLSDGLQGNENVDNALLTIECDDGSVFKPEGEIVGGVYLIPTGQLNTEKKYRLHISYESEEYASDFLNPIQTAEIDSIAASKKGPGEKVIIHVSTHDDKDESRYYNWDYKEIWELKSELLANAGFRDGLNSPVDLYTLENSKNIYFCWGRENSNRFILATSDKIGENVIYQKELLSVEPSDDRFSILYYIEVEQKQIRKEAYDYFYNLQKNVDEAGGLFAPIPSEWKGNIRNVARPDEYLIGYIDVSLTTSAKRFFPEEDGFYEPPIFYCRAVDGHPDKTYAIVEWHERTQTIISSAPKECVDCRLRGTKDRPYFWPNNHY